MIDWDRIEPWNYIVDSVAYEYHKKFPIVELADIRQSLYQWFAEHPNKLNDWEAIGKKDAKNLLYRSLRNQALDYCQKWKAKSVGYEVSDNYYYDASLVKAMLPSVLRGEINKPGKLNIGLPGKPPAPNEGGNAMAMMIEIDYAYWKLDKDERKILFLCFAEDLTDGQVGEELGLGTEDAVRMRVNRIIKKLINKIGGYKPFYDADSEPVDEEDADLQVLQ